MAHWQNIMASSELAAGEVKEVEWQGQDLLLYRLASGECRATSAWCPHMRNYLPNGLPPATPLSALLSNDVLTCPWHGWRFDGLGHCTHLPAGQRVPQKVARGEIIMRCWTVREHKKMIQLGAEIQS